MINYVIEGASVKDVLNSSENVIAEITELQELNPSIEFNIHLESPNEHNLNWSIILKIEDGESKSKIFKKGIKSY